LEKKNQAIHESQRHQVVRKDLLFVVLVSLFYLLLSYCLVGLKSDQIFLAFLFSALYLASPLTRKFILGFSIFIVYWIIFDYMKAFPNYEFNDVHIKSLHDAEVSLFGISTNQILETPSEYWLHNHTPFLDVMAGFFYVSWVPLPLAFAVFLFWKNREQFLKFSLTFFIVNVIGFIIYYLYPAAPPWYPIQFGFDFVPNTQPNTAGLIRFDQYFGVTIFESIYAKGSNVFAAMPSLHSSYPLIGLYFAAKNKFTSLSILFFVTMIGIWFSAVYTGHHYMLDVSAGIGCGVAGIILFNLLIKKNVRCKILFDRYLQLIS
jgi:membrane-associated phospholipid phosphatase